MSDTGHVHTRSDPKLDGAVASMLSEHSYYVPASPAAVTTPDQLPQALCADPDRLAPSAKMFPMRISAHVMSMIRSQADPIARQFIPTPEELHDRHVCCDPLNESGQSPSPLVIHRYPGRVLYVVSTRCAAHCRFCMRKRNPISGAVINPSVLAQGFNYIRDNHQINEVILSGGDPLMLSDAALLSILASLRRLTHIRVLRIHTRIPLVWPQRMTSSLVDQLAALRPLYINVHVNHPDELTPRSTRVLNLMADAGIPLGSQTVLLRGVNDRAVILKALFETLLENRVRPYYLHQIDRVPGTSHYHVTIEAGLSLMKRLQGHLSGMAIPRYMIDLPGGGGKIELLPERIIRRQPQGWDVVNFDGRRYTIGTP